MFRHRRVALSVVLFSLLGVWAGCGRGTPAPEPRSGNKPAARPKDGPPTTAAAAETKSKPKPVEAPPPRSIPQVALSDELMATCLVNVGDMIPAGQVVAADGKPQAVRSLLGKKLTVLFFWTTANPYSMEEVEDLNADIAQPLADKGVAVVGINHGDTPEKVRDVAKQLKLAFPVFHDTKAEFFGKLAKEKVLRTYLLDAQGKILWFDVEYSRSTQRDLSLAIDVALGKAG